MTAPFPPPTMKSWQYSSIVGGLEKNLRINSVTPVPKPKSDQHLVHVAAAALNPIDYKLAENPWVHRFLFSKPATPGMDFAGRIVTPAAGSSLKSGDRVFGVAGKSLIGGALAEFALTAKQSTIPLPNNINLIDAATMGVAAVTAYQSIVPKAKKGDMIFINGGSGGTGVFGIQMAKAIGCHVTTTCSTPNIDLCKSLGADKVVDYKKIGVIDELKTSGNKFDLIVDNVATDPGLYWNCHEYMKPGADYMMVGGTPTLGFLATFLKMNLLPSFLGGGQRKIVAVLAKMKPEDLERIAKWMEEGKVKAIIDQKFPFEQSIEAFGRLKTGRAKGKIVIDVASETYRKAWSD